MAGLSLDFAPRGSSVPSLIGAQPKLPTTPPPAPQPKIPVPSLLSNPLGIKPPAPTPVPTSTPAQSTPTPVTGKKTGFNGSQNPADYSDVDMQALNLAKAIRQQEGGVNAGRGTSGETGAWQFMPGTWKNDAQAILGDPNAPQTPQNQSQVAYTKIKQWKDSGLSPDQVASMWNHGSPDWKNVVGSKVVNGKTVNYNTPAYVKGVLSNYQKLKSAVSAPGSISSQLTGGPAVPGTTPIGGVSTPKPPGFFSDPNTGMNIATGVGKFLGSIGQTGANILSGVTSQKPVGLEDKTLFQPQGTAQNIGFQGANIASFLVPGFEEEQAASAAAKAAEEAPAIVQKAAPILAKAGTSAADLAARTAATGGTGKQILGAGLLGGAGSLIGQGLGALAKQAAPALESAAETQYTKALKPGGKVDKAIAKKIVPGLLERGVSGSLESILKEATTKGTDAWSAIEKGLAAVPADTMVSTESLNAALEAEKQAITVPLGGGKTMVGDPQKMAVIDGMQQQIQQMGNEVPWGSMQKFRQILDKSVNEASGGYFGTAAAKNSTQVGMEKQMADAMRGILNDKQPDIAKLNQEYSFWTNAKKVASDTIDRTKGNAPPLVGRAGKTAGIVAGLMKSTIGLPVYLGSLLTDFMQSPYWNTTSAVVKNQIADALAKGAFDQVPQIITRVKAASTKKGN